MADVQDRKRRNLKNLLRPSAPTGLFTSISLLEQAVFVNTSFPAPSVLRGSVRLDVSKKVQLQDLCIKFTGLNRVHKFSRFYNKECIIDQSWSVPQLEYRHDSAQDLINLANTDSSECVILNPGKYSHHFELTLNDPLPETFDVGGCTLRYYIRAIATIRGPGPREQASHQQEVVVVHCPHDDIYLHEVNQISISRIWNRQIAYNVELADKGAPIGGKIPISMRIAYSDITYLAVQIFLAQKINFPGIPGKQSQLRKRLLTKSKCNDLSKNAFNDPSSLSLGHEDGTIVIAGSIPLIDDSNAHLRLHPDVNSSKVKASHTILVLIDITIPNKNDKEKNTICRLTAETPFYVRSSQSQHYDLSVPRYSETHNQAMDDRFDILQSLPPSFDSLSPQSLNSPTKEFDISPQARPISMCSLPSTNAEAVSLTPLYPPPAYESVVGS